MLILIFIYGLCIGSFLNVCIYRIPSGRSIIRLPSCCGSCGHRLNYIDMLPVASYVWCKGRCRYCNATYSIQYPIIEMLNGLLYLLIALKYGLSFYSLVLCILVSLLLVVGAIDLRHMIIPDVLIVIGFLLGFMLIIYDNKGLFDKLSGFIIGFGSFALIAFTTNSMGGGDIKLMGVIGLLFGIEGAIFVSLVSFIIGAAVAILLMGLRIKGRKDKISFGPFISLAAIIFILYGREILESYYNVFF